MGAQSKRMRDDMATPDPCGSYRSSSTRRLRSRIPIVTFVAIGVFLLGKLVGFLFELSMQLFNKRASIVDILK